MRTNIVSNHFTENGVPMGGTTFGQGFAIGWQCGALESEGVREEPNGAFVEDIIAAAKDRLEYYQKSKFACSHNAEAIGHLINALDALDARTKDRQKRSVEGTHNI